VSAGSLIATLGGDGVKAGIAIAMLAGGVVAAPLAAMVVRHIPPRLLGLAVSLLLLVTNVRELAGWAGIGDARWLLYGLAVVLVAGAALRPRIAARRRQPAFAGADVPSS
jgi:hypothetical protein